MLTIFHHFVLQILISHSFLVSIQTISQSITALVNGLKQVNNELNLSRPSGATDKFATVMRVSAFLFSSFSSGARVLIVRYNK